MADIRMEKPGGYCPVQSDGTINGFPAYFRARHNVWRLTIVKAARDPVLARDEDVLYERSEDYKLHEPFAAGYMPTEEALAIIRRCAEEFDRGLRGDYDDVDAYRKRLKERHDQAMAEFSRYMKRPSEMPLTEEQLKKLEEKGKGTPDPVVPEDENL